MARTPFGSKSNESSDTGSFFRPAAPPMSAPTAGGLTAFIDQGSEFEGKLSFKDTVRIDGRFRGEISSENTLIVGESGEIEAKIKSRTVAVSGNVLGDVVATTKVLRIALRGSFGGVVQRVRHVLPLASRECVSRARVGI